MQVTANLVVALCAVSSVLWASADSYADTIRVQGSTTFTAEIVGPHQRAIELASGQELDVIPNKSTPGLVALLEHKADLIMISTGLQYAISSARKTRSDLPYDRLQAFPITRTRVVLALHPLNPVRTASPDMVRRVLRGEAVNWRELGGLNLPIRLVMVRDGGGVKLTIENELLGGDAVTATDAIQVANGERVPRVVEQEPGALGLMQFNLLRQYNLPELTLNHPVVQELNFVTLGEPTPAVKAVIDATRGVASSSSD
jgi:ABC-type phosphate transport system substrate-binding protein